MCKEKVAIIGSGISGLSAAYFLSSKFEVHLFEKNKILGGHTRTIDFKNELDKTLSIDTGFIVFNDKNYPDLSSFFSHLGVKTENTDMSFAVSCSSPNIEYGGSSLNSLFSQRKNIFSIKFISLLFEIRKFYKKNKNLDINESYENLTIEEFLNHNNFSKEIRDLHIYPMISSIWSTNKIDVKNFPFLSFLNFFKNHGLFDMKNRPKWKFVSGGSYNYIKKIVNKNLFEYYTDCKIKIILREKNKIQLVDSDNKIKIFDKVIFATHADQAIELIDDLSDLEMKILSKFKYTKNKAYLHSDKNLMPKKINAWSSWNFLQNTKSNVDFSLTYWMNNLQKINDYNNYFVSINPDIKPKKIIDKTIFEHPIFNIETSIAQKKLYMIQGFKNTFYCGSYCGYGFHEDGIQSAAYIAEKLKIDLPWQRSNKFINRLNY
jgi:predicted NAD/FAD-binding protein